jgi:peptidoglycan hydrolase-like protein with peptidoglycan-binding domain
MSWVTIDGERVASAVADDFRAMNEEFHRVWGVWLVVTSGTRTSQEQIDIFLSRYTTNPGGRHVYDTRWWNGVLYYRVSSAGTVAQPGTSNHEENGPIGPRALDIQDTGGDAGILTHSSARAQWYHNNSHRWNFDSAGDGFGEEWHKQWTGGDPHGGTAAGDNTVKMQQLWLNQTRGEQLVADGVKGSLTTEAFKRYQTFLRAFGYTGDIDGDWGPGTQGAHDKYAAAWNAEQANKPPAFPLPASQWFGPEAGGDNSISGWHHPSGTGDPGLKQWQTRMKERGWTINPDGYYGPMGATEPTGETAGVAKAFQAEKGLTADGLIGPKTWEAAWNAPLTPPPAPEEPGTPPPQPVPLPDNPRNLPTYEPVYPGAKWGLKAPLGDGLRGEKGEDHTPVPFIIDREIEHHTGTTVDQLDWFSYRNSRSSCPNWFIRPDGTVFELIRPLNKPALTGPEWNWRSVGWEIQATNSVTWEGTAAQFEAVAQLLAWLSSYNGKELDGVPVVLPLDREHFINHREALPGTECPGNWWASRMDAQLERAREIFAEKYEETDPPVDPDPDPDSYVVSKNLGDAIKGLVDRAFA